MPSKILADPAGVDRGGSSDYTAYTYRDGGKIVYDGTTQVWQANAAITEGDAVYLVAPTTTTPARVAVITANATKSIMMRFIGIAVEAAAAGDIVRVRTDGIALANVATSNTAGSNVASLTGAAPALGLPAVASDTAGQLTGGGTGVTAAAFQGEIFGTWLAAASSGKAPLLIKKL